MYSIEFTRNALKSLKKIDPVYQRLIIDINHRKDVYR